MVFVMDIRCVYCEVRHKFLYKILILGCKYKALYSMLVDGIWRFYFSQQALEHCLQQRVSV